MPWKRDSIQEIQERLENNLISSLNLEQGHRHNLINILSKAFAGAVHGLHGYGDYLARQLFPTTAEKEYLEQHARIYGIERKAAQKSTGKVSFTGSDGSFFPEKTEMVADGLVFISLNTATAENGVVQINIESKELGSNNNISANTQIKLVSPVVGFLPDGEILEDISGGSDIESDESLLERILSLVQQEPAGGSVADFKNWVLAIDKHGVAVSKVWISPKEMGLGTVTIRILTDSGFPSESECKKIYDYLVLLAPLCCEIFIYAPIAKNIAFSIDSLQPDTLEIRKLVEANLENLILEKQEPAGILLISQVREAIGNTQGVVDYNLISPSTNIHMPAGEICTFGGVTWNS